jgi:hypothetical protein
MVRVSPLAAADSSALGATVASASPVASALANVIGRTPVRQVNVIGQEKTDLRVTKISRAPIGSPAQLGGGGYETIDENR